MAEQLRITTPISTNDPLGKAKPSREAGSVESLQPNVVDPKVNSQQAEDKESPYFSWQNGSVFQKFLVKFAQTPALMQSLQKFLVGSLTQPFAYEGTATALQSAFSKFAESIQMDGQQMIDQLLFQQQNSGKFSGPLFSMLHNILSSSKSPELDACIGRFLKSYDAFQSMTETMNQVMVQLKDILRGIPKGYRQEIEKSINRMQVLHSGKGLENNLKILKEEILPQLGKYVSATNDYGRVRDKIGMLLHQVSKLNISSAEELSNRFQEMLDFLRYQMNAPAKTLGRLQQYYIQKMTTPENTENEFTESLLNALSCIKNQNISATSKAVLNDTMNALLMDQSVYMPFTHLFLPALYEGVLLCSDIWIEKNGEDHEEKEVDTNEKKIHLSFDIQNIGSFQAQIILKGNDVSFQIHYPEQLQSKDDEIRKKISGILVENGFHAQKVYTSSQSIDMKDEVLRKVLDKKGMVNVVV